MATREQLPGARTSAIHDRRVGRLTPLVALLLAACGVGQQVPADEPSATAHATPSLTSPSPTPAPTVASLDGSWATEPVDCTEQVAALKRAGFTDADLMLGGWEADGPCVTKSLAVRFEGSGVYFLEPDGSVGAYAKVRIVDDHRLQISPPAGTFVFTLEYTLNGDQLTVHSVEAEEMPEPGSDAFGDLIASTQGWTSAPFFRRESAGSTPATGPDAYVASRYPVSFSLPAGWSIEADAEEAFFVSPDGNTWLTLATGQPEPDDTVSDRVRLVQEALFSDCELEPTSDATVSLGGKDGIVWSARCGAERNLSVQAIHENVGYRLTLTSPVLSEDELALIMDALIETFAFID